MEVAVLGGAMSGLAAAERLSRLDRVDRVELFERQSYDDKRVACGEAINDASLIPLAKTPENGFCNEVSGFSLRVHPDRDHAADAQPIARAQFPCSSGYICERATVERRWAERLADRGVTITTGVNVSVSRYWEIVENHELVVDATGQPAVSIKARDLTSEYTGRMIALNATVEGDFTSSRRWPRIFFEGYLGYSWVFPKSANRANVGIGWAGQDRPDDYRAAFAAAAERNGFPAPEDVTVATIPRGPSLSPDRVAFPDDGVYLVGDAAGVANRYQGEGICQGIRSASLLSELVAADRLDRYPEQLYASMKSEYRLAHLMRGAWVEHRSPDLLAAVVDALDGTSVDEITRSPRAIAHRLLRRPTSAARLLADTGMLRRLYEGYTDGWEYTA